MSEPSDKRPSITEEYEQRALTAWCSWYCLTQPTIGEASGQVHPIARETVGILVATQVLLLLEEHADWIDEQPRQRFDSDKMGFLTIGELARRHLVRHLEQVIQKRGLQALWAGCGKGER